MCIKEYYYQESTNSDKKITNYLFIRIMGYGEK